MRAGKEKAGRSTNNCRPPVGSETALLLPPVSRIAGLTRAAFVFAAFAFAAAAFNRRRRDAPAQALSSSFAAALRAFQTVAGVLS